MENMHGVESLEQATTIGQNFLGRTGAMGSNCSIQISIQIWTFLRTSVELRSSHHQTETSTGYGPMNSFQEPRGNV